MSLFDINFILIRKMEIFLCTFIIKLQYVKRTKQSMLKKGVPTTFEAILKSSKNYIIASGNSRPTFLNDTAWFNEKFQINSDLLFNPQTQTYNQSLVTLEIKTVSKFVNTSYSQSFNLAEIAQAKIISERQYSLNGGLIANIELSCIQMQSKGIKPLRKGENSEQKSVKSQERSSFLMIEKISFAGQTQKETDQYTPQFHQGSFKSFQEAMNQFPLFLEDPNVQLKGLRQQLHKQIQEHEQTKIQLKSVKQLLENEYNVNRQQKITIHRLQKQLQSQKNMTKSVQNQLAEADNESTQLSATISQKQSEIIQLFTLIDQYKQRISILSKKLEVIDPLQRSKAQLQWENGTLKKQNQSLKLILNKQHLNENELNSELQHFKSENTKLKTIKEKADEQLNKVLKREKQAAITINKLAQQRDLIKRQTTKWRSQFSLQSQRKDEQINHLQEHYGQLFKRYQELLKKTENNPDMISKEVFDTTVRNYQKKIDQHEDKQSKFRQQLQIIQQQISKMQEMLQQKQQNQQILLQHIKKLQKEVDIYAASDNWWASILDRNQTSALSDQNDPDGEKTKLINKNMQLVQLLQKNSKVILQGEKLKIQLAALKKQNQQLSQKQNLLNDEHNELKEKIASLYKENKKLQDKYAKISKQNEHLNKKNLWLQQEITQSKQAEKDARQDYEIVSYQLYKIETAKAQQKNKYQRNSNFLSVIKENSQQLIASSHHLIKQNSTKDQPKNQSQINIKIAIYDQLSTILQQRATYAQQIRMHLQNRNQQNPNDAFQGVKKQIKRISLSTSKIKSVLIKSGFKQYARQWQSSLLTLSSALQTLLNTIQ